MVSFVERIVGFLLLLYVHFELFRKHVLFLGSLHKSHDRIKFHEDSEMEPKACVLN